MIIFLYGIDNYRIRENINIIVDSYRKKYKSGLNLNNFDLDEFKTINDFNTLEMALKSNSFFDEARLIIIKNVFNNKILISKIIFFINEFQIVSNKKIILLFAEFKGTDDIKKINKELFNVLVSKDNLVKEIMPLSGSKLLSWVKNKFKENNCLISSSAVDYLVKIVGNDSWDLINEINKLCNYKIGGIINEKDIDLLIIKKADNNIFDLIDAIGNRNKAKAFELTYRILNSGFDPYYLLNMLVYHFENLLSAFEGVAPRNLHPFVAKKVIFQARNFTKKDLLDKFNQLFNFDIASKDGKINLEDALYNFIILS
jgi:DNA polymerase-3 subunit delta